MSTIQEFLQMDTSALDETVEVAPIKAMPNLKFEIRAVGADEYEKISKLATKKTKAKNGAVTSSEVDALKLQNLLVESAVVSPDLKNAELQEKFNAVGDPAGVVRHMLRAGEFVDLAKAIQDYSGFDADTDLLEEAKN